MAGELIAHRPGSFKQYSEVCPRQEFPDALNFQFERTPIDTDLNPAAGDWAAPQKANTALDRYGSVDEVAALVAFVAGPEASYITGANLTVDGGTNA